MDKQKCGRFLPFNQVHFYKFLSKQAEISDTSCRSKSVLQLLSMDTATEIMSQVVYTGTLFEKAEEVPW